MGLRECGEPPAQGHVAKAEGFARRVPADHSESSRSHGAKQDRPAILSLNGMNTVDTGTMRHIGEAVEIWRSDFSVGELRRDSMQFDGRSTVPLAAGVSLAIVTVVWTSSPRG
jgi:hypothetical protein